MAAHIGQIGGVYDEAPDFAAVDRETLKALLARPFPAFREDAGVAMRRLAIENNLTTFTSLDTVRALLDVLEAVTSRISTIDE